MLRQSFPELAYNEKASLFLIEGHFSTAAAVPFLALPAQGGPALAVGPSSSPSSITSCVAKVCYEAQLCTGPQKLWVTTVPTCRVSKVLAKLEQPILLAWTPSFGQWLSQKRALSEAWTHQAGAALKLHWGIGNGTPPFHAHVVSPCPLADFICCKGPWLGSRLLVTERCREISTWMNTCLFLSSWSCSTSINH